MLSIWRVLRVLGLCGVLVVAVALAACGGSSDAATTSTGGSTSTAGTTSTGSTVSHGGPVRDHVSFVDGLRARGVTVKVLEAASQPFLRPAGTRLGLSGAGVSSPAVVESYNYDDTDLGTNAVAVAKQDADQITPDGTPKTVSVQWVASPHFFRAERLLVLYVGSDKAVLTVLTDLLSVQFAGR